jgi:hypothetical protein
VEQLVERLCADEGRSEFQPDAEGEERVRFELEAVDALVDKAEAGASRSAGIAGAWPTN